MDTLPDLRVTIAESMTALAWSLPGRLIKTQAAHRRLIDGAETLRWCAQRDAPSYEEMKADRDAANEAREDAEIIQGELVDNIRYAVSKWEHGDACPAGQMLATADDSCNCALDARRKSVLDAVA